MIEDIRGTLCLLYLKLYFYDLALVTHNTIWHNNIKRNNNKVFSRKAQKKFLKICILTSQYFVFLVEVKFFLLGWLAPQRNPHWDNNGSFYPLILWGKPQRINYRTFQNIKITLLTNSDLLINAIEFPVNQSTADTVMGTNSEMNCSSQFINE